MKSTMHFLWICFALLRCGMAPEFTRIEKKMILLGSDASLVSQGYVQVHSPGGGFDLPDTWLKQACTQVGGEYLEERHICLCPSSSFFSFQVALDSGVPYAACQPIKWKDQEESPSLKILLDPRSFFDGYSFKKNEEVSYWKWALTNRSSMFPVVYQKNGAVEHSRWYLDHTPDMDLVGFPHTGEASMDSGGMLLFRMRPLIEPEFTRLKDCMQGFTEQEPAEVKLDGFDVDLIGMIRGLLDAIGKSKKDEEKAYEARSQYGCAEFCSFTQEWKDLSKEQKKYSARWTKTYVSAAPYHNEVQILDHKGRTVVRIFLTPIEDVSHLVVYEFQEFLDENRITRKKQIYDRGGEKIPKNIPSNSLLENKLPSSPFILSSEPFQEEQSIRAVICENGFPTEKDPLDPKWYEALLFGPHRKESFYGWVQSSQVFGPSFSEKDFLGTSFYWSGTTIQDFLIQGRSLDGSSDHARQVSQVYREAGGEKIVPLGLLECVDRPDLWVDSVLRQKVKVVNLSSAFSYDAKMGARTKLMDTIRTGRMLWVGSPGNGAERVDQKRSYSIPSNQGVLPALLCVVPGNDQGSLDQSIATWGIDVADLVAPGGSGSLAIPQVTATAAKIAKLYENLTPAQIKLAILLGVTIPSDTRGRLQFQEVRSGGSLDADQALAIAQKLSNHANLLKKRDALLEMLLEMHCRFSMRHNGGYKRCHHDGRSKRQARERLNRLVSTGILSF